MKLTKLLALASSAFGLAVLTAAQPNPSFLDWTGELRTGRNEYRLENITIKKSLRYASRAFGINLDWTTDRNAYIRFFEAQFGATAPKSILAFFGKQVALYVNGGGYLKYENRNVGVNLGWSTKPVYEWYLIGACETGLMATPTKPLGLYNTAARDFLVYQNRSAGVNLGWSKTGREAAWRAEAKQFVANLRAYKFSGMAALVSQLLGV